MRQLQNDYSIQLNSLLYFDSEPDRTNWINERYVNLLTYDGIVDYVDSTNYSGMFQHIRNYSINELSDDFRITLKNAVLNMCFAALWVDEYYLPASSHRYNVGHFVHHLFVYGYSEETDQYDAIFFDITKGQVIISIDADELCKAVSGVSTYYEYGAILGRWIKHFQYIGRVQRSKENFILTSLSETYCITFTE